MYDNQFWYYGAVAGPSSFRCRCVQEPVTCQPEDDFDVSKIELQTNLSEDYAPAVAQLMMCAGGAVLRQQDGRHAGQVHLLPDHRHPVLRQHAGGDDDANDANDANDDIDGDRRA